MNPGFNHWWLSEGGPPRMEQATEGVPSIDGCRQDVAKVLKELEQALQPKVEGLTDFSALHGRDDQQVERVHARVSRTCAVTTASLRVSKSRSRRGSRRSVAQVATSEGVKHKGSEVWSSQ